MISRWMLISNRAFGVPTCKERANEAAATYKAVENGARVFDQGLYVTVRADERRPPRCRPDSHQCAP